MVGTIWPVVYGPNRHCQRYPLISLYSVSQVAGAVLTGMVLSTIGMLGRVFLSWELMDLLRVQAVFAAIGAMSDLKLLAFRLPSRSWQVPQSWKRLPPSGMVVLYGFGIGLGVITRIPFASFYLVMLAC